MCDFKKYDAAIQVCDIATQRLRCLNRRLSESPTEASLTKKTRAKLRHFYNEHLEKCEGIILPIN